MCACHEPEETARLGGSFWSFRENQQKACSIADPRRVEAFRPLAPRNGREVRLSGGARQFCVERAFDATDNVIKRHDRPARSRGIGVHHSFTHNNAVFTHPVARLY
jgi:hypothetical protein